MYRTHAVMLPPPNPPDGPRSFFHVAMVSNALTAVSVISGHLVTGVCCFCTCLVFAYPCLLFFGCLIFAYLERQP